VLFAGFKDGDKVNDLVKFSFASSKWTDIHPKGLKPCARSNHSAVVFQRKMIIFGGADDNG
jgi:hypothetical protein